LPCLLVCIIILHKVRETSSWVQHGYNAGSLTVVWRRVEVRLLRLITSLSDALQRENFRSVLDVLVYGCDLYWVITYLTIVICHFSMLELHRSGLLQTMLLDLVGSLVFRRTVRISLLLGGTTMRVCISIRVRLITVR
jgi:hypothetical protein